MSIVKNAIVHETNPAIARVRVRLLAEGIISNWLPVLQVSVGFASFYAMPEVGEHVVCGFDEDLEQGYVIGSIYDNSNKPSDKLSGSLFGLRFADGKLLVVANRDGELNIESNSMLSIKAGSSEMELSSSGIKLSGNSSVDGNLEIDGDLTVDGEIEAKSIKAKQNITSENDITAGTGAIAISLLTHKHTVPGVGTTSPPIP